LFSQAWLEKTSQVSQPPNPMSKCSLISQAWLEKTSQISQPPNPYLTFCFAVSLKINVLHAAKMLLWHYTVEFFSDFQADTASQISSNHKY